MVEAYGTTEGFKTYHTGRGRAVAIADYEDEDIEAARLVGSEFVDGRYRLSFPGTKVGMRAQVREWPRVGGVDRDGYAITADVVPTEIENATYEAALRQLQAAGSLIRDYTPNRYSRVQVDGAVSATYNTFNSAADAQPQYVAIDQILSPILTGSASVSSLSGPSARA